MLAPWWPGIKPVRLIKWLPMWHAQAARHAKLGRDAIQRMPPGACPGGGTVAPPTGPGEAADAACDKTPYNACHRALVPVVARWRFRPGRAGQPTRLATRPHTTWHGGASDRAGRGSRRGLRQDPIHRGTVALPTGPGEAADAACDKTPYNVARWRFRPGRARQPTPPATRPHTPWHGGASDRAGRGSRRRLRQDPIQRGTVAPPTGPGETADAACDKTPYNACHRALVPVVARWRFRPGRAGQPTPPATRPHTTHATGRLSRWWHGGASDRAGRGSRRRLRQDPIHRGTVARPAGPGGAADAACDKTPYNACHRALVPVVARWRLRPGRAGQPTPPAPPAGRAGPPRHANAAPTAGRR